MSPVLQPDYVLERSASAALQGAHTGQGVKGTFKSNLTSVSSVLRPEYVSERSASAACTAAAMRSCARRRRRPESRLASAPPAGVLAGEAALSCRFSLGVNDWPPAQIGSCSMSALALAERVYATHVCRRKSWVR